MYAKGRIFRNSFYEEDLDAGKKPATFRGRIKDYNTEQEYEVLIWKNKGIEGKPEYLGIVIQDSRKKSEKNKIT